MKTSHILYEPIYTKHIHSRHYLIKLWWKLWHHVFAFIKCNWRICSHCIHVVLIIIPFIVQNGLPKMMLEIILPHNFVYDILFFFIRILIVRLFVIIHLWAYNNFKRQKRSISSCFMDICSNHNQRLVPICFLIFWQSDFSLAQKYGLAQYLAANLRLIRFYQLSLFRSEM